MIKDRIMELIETKCGGNKRAFAQMVGLSPSSVENVVGSRGGEPGFEFLEKILSSFEDVDANWLILGKGRTIKNPTVNSDDGPYKILYEEGKIGLKERDREIARLNTLIGRYEERLSKSQAHFRADEGLPYDVSDSDVPPVAQTDRSLNQ